MVFYIFPVKFLNYNNILTNILNVVILSILSILVDAVRSIILVGACIAIIKNIYVL